MSKIDQAIQDINKTIVSNIEKLQDDAGLLSQNILSQLRNLVEHIAMKVYVVDNNKVDEVSYENITNSLKYIKSQSQYIELRKFYDNLEVSASHYTMDEENSERIMHKYIEKLYRIKDFMRIKFGLSILENICKFPLKKDTQTEEYYKKIIDKVKSSRKNQNSKMERCYIQKKKTIFQDGKIYYELSVTLALSNVSKFDRIIVFTSADVKTNYAVKLWLNESNIDIIENSVPIKIAVDWQVSIRPCEFLCFSNIFGNEIKGIGTSTEAVRLNEFLTSSNFNLVDIVNLPVADFERVKSVITAGLKVVNIFGLLERCRNISDGTNVVKYLLYTMNYKIMRNQINSANPKLSNLNLAYGCIPFDEMPFCSSLLQHKTRFYDLIESIGVSGREHEIVARKIKNNTEISGKIYTKLEELEYIENLQEKIDKYNEKLYHKHQSRKIKIENKMVYIDEYESTLKQIIEKLLEKSSDGIKGYENSVKAWLNLSSEVDCESKKEILPKLFENSKTAFIYGSAGTGKTTIVKHLTNYLNSNNNNKNILYLAHTNTAVDNLKKRIGENNGQFKTITSLKNSSLNIFHYDLVVIDECSTVSNKDILEILNFINAELYLFVGDVHQIEAIEFGNWFNSIKFFIKKEVQFELNKPYRTTDQNLLKLWKVVRDNDENISDIIARFGYSKTLDNSVFTKSKEDEIVLCLNYDGLYGINNINRLLQSANKNKQIEFGLSTYKVNDPILFNETKRFGSVLHNNLKGKIIDFHDQNNYIEFVVEIDKAITELDVRDTDINFVDVGDNGKTIVSFRVTKTINTDEEDESVEKTSPFQVAYAMSIHKSQGLEYDSVKLVIANEIDERITHNIFYTAITRAKKDLKIFWSKETMQQVVSSFNIDIDNRDALILKGKLTF